MSTGRVCAQPGLDPKDSGGRNHNPQPTRVKLRIGRIGSCQFRMHIGPFWVRYRGSKSGRISTDLAGSIEIWPIFLHILWDLAEISLYRWSFEFRLTGFPTEHEICDWKIERHRAGRVLRFLRQSNRDSNRWYRVFTPETRSRPNHSSDRAVVGSESFGPGGCWTAHIWWPIT